ncbi:hypothetical protein EDD18DRAFT_1350823 [Armillaria luteobubalina]|uniref:Uncharacterized protein n=1 Tax=Armillaria luteobubalina TaxID=153913 RepID=A0AA39UUQ8_9AGAR|nr:hypothetical protein EDD18DRAFT_1350823 [Armillaria luteobubalina]
MAVHFANGTKYEDLSKHIIFVTHNILTETKDVHGYHLLKCVRSYMELCMYASFNLHTKHSIQAIQDELVKFLELIREYEQLTKSVKPGAKSWNFPKVHSHKHMVDDILEKGVMLNYNKLLSRVFVTIAGPSYLGTQQPDYDMGLQLVGARPKPGLLLQS